MSRFLDVRELAERVTALTMFRIATSSPAATAVATTPIADGDTSLTVAAITGFADTNDIMLLGQKGDADMLKVSGSPSAGAITLAYPVKIPAAIGSKVTKMTGTDLGDFQGGITLTGSSQLNEIQGSISKIAVGSFISGGKIGGSVNLLGFNIENLQTAFGAPESVTGTGATGTPYAGMVRGVKIGTEGLSVIRATGLMNDGVTTFWLDWLNVRAVGQINSNVGGGTNAATVGMQWNATCLGLRIFN